MHNFEWMREREREGGREREREKEREKRYSHKAQTKQTFNLVNWYEISWDFNKLNYLGGKITTAL